MIFKAGVTSSASHDDAVAPDLAMPDDASWKEAWKLAEERRAFWASHLAEYTHAYPEEFVAVFDKKVIAHHPELRTLIGALADLGFDVGDVWVRYMVTTDRPFLL